MTEKTAMFRVTAAKEGSASSHVTFGVLAAILVATLVNIWLLIEVRKEQQAVSEIIRGGVAEDIRKLGSLPGELRWQFLFSLLVLFVLIASAATLVYALRAYAKSQASLRDVKILAWEVLSSMDLAVVTTDLAGSVTSLNPRATDLLGMTMDDVGKPLSRVCDAGPKLGGLASQALKRAAEGTARTARRQYGPTVRGADAWNGASPCSPVTSADGSGKSISAIRFQANSPVDEQDVHLRQSGHRLRLRVECCVLRDAATQVSGTVLHIRDVTERALMESQMQRMERFMGLGTLAAGLHHEIKNPLSALALHLQLLEERLADTIDSESAENISVLKNEVTRISGVLESFRNYASLHTLHITELEVEPLLRQTAELIRPEAEQQSVVVEVVPSQNVLPTVVADATRIEQVLLNLTMNALDQMKRGGKLTLSVDSDSHMAIIHVTDTGPGISDRIRSRIFDPYFTTRNEGMGMGLAVCDKIVQQHGGRIDVDTNRQGTTFHVVIPLQPARDSSRDSAGDMHADP